MSIRVDACRQEIARINKEDNFTQGEADQQTPRYVSVQRRLAQAYMALAKALREDYPNDSSKRQEARSAYRAAADVWSLIGASDKEAEAQYFAQQS